jgi:site-specific DNA-methyltransferase (adenine-specific)
LKRIAIAACLLVLAASPALALRRHDYNTIKDLFLSYGGLALLVSPKAYYKNRGITIYQGDCREILPVLSAESVDMIWTDPPYGNNNQKGDLADHLNKLRGARSRPIENDGRKEMMRLVDFMLDEAFRLLKRVSCVCVCSSGGGGPNGPMFAWLANRMDVDGLKFFHSVIWDKKNPGLGWRYRRRHEMVMVSHREDGKLAWADPDVAISNIISCSPPYRRSHPNEKPEQLIEQFIQVHTRPGDTVLDPLMGSGTTLAVAHRLGRKAIGIELDKRYCRIAVARLEGA